MQRIAYRHRRSRAHLPEIWGHEVPVERALGDEIMREGVRRYDPDLAIAPMLTTAIPDIWSSWPCFIVHPGPKGDRRAPTRTPICAWMIAPKTRQTRPRLPMRGRAVTVTQAAALGRFAGTDVSAS